jgi:hypothetical protein
MTDPLKDVIPDRPRKFLYAILALIGLTLTGLNAGYAQLGHGLPDWLVFATAFYAAVAGPGFAVARANVGR